MLAQELLAAATIRAPVSAINGDGFGLYFVQD